jgi:hypothetical protein
MSASQSYNSALNNLSAAKVVAAIPVIFYCVASWAETSRRRASSVTAENVFDQVPKIHIGRLLRKH